MMGPLMLYVLIGIILWSWLELGDRFEDNEMRIIKIFALWILLYPLVLAIALFKQDKEDRNDHNQD